MNGLLKGIEIAPRSSLEEEVYAKLLEEIVSLRIASNQRLTVDSLARLLGVSQTPVRAALIRLAADGLVEKKFNSGYRVTFGCTREEFEEVYELRLLMEPILAARAAKLAAAEEKAELSALSHEMVMLTKDAENVPYREFALLDRSFHIILYTIAGNKLFRDVLSRLHTHLHLNQLRSNSTVANEAIREHNLIVAAIIAGDEGAASKEMRNHIALSLKRMQASYDDA